MSHHHGKADPAGSQALPHRQATGATSDDEAVPDFDLSNVRLRPRRVSREIDRSRRMGLDLGPPPRTPTGMETCLRISGELYFYYGEDAQGTCEGVREDIESLSPSSWMGVDVEMLTIHSRLSLSLCARAITSIRAWEELRVCLRTFAPIHKYITSAVGFVRR